MSLDVDINEEDEPTHSLLKQKSKSGRSRPDVAAKKKLRKSNQEIIVKSALKRYIAVGNEQIKDKICQAINSRVEAFSKRCFQGSMILSGLLKELYENVEDLSSPLSSVEIPDIFDQTFVRTLMLGVESCIKEPCPQLKEYLERYPCLVLQNFARHFGDSNIYSSGAIKYVTNLKNYYVVTIEQRIKHFLLDYQKVYNLTKAERVYMLYKINGWNFPELKENNKKIKLLAPRQNMEETITTVRNILGFHDSKEVINETWLKTKNNLFNIITFFIFINRFKDKHQLPKKISIVPMCSIRAKFITIDTTTLYGIMTEAGILDKKKCNLKAFASMGHDHWKSFLNFSKLEGSNCTFTGTIETDGVSLCTHFTKPKTIILNKEDQKRKKEEEFNKERLATARVLGVDPGRSNILYVVEDKTQRIYKLTRKQYYQESGINKCKRHAQKWQTSNLYLQLANKDLSKNSSKGVSVDEHFKFVDTYMNHQDVLWSEYLKPRWGRQSLRVYGGKKKVFATFCNTIKKDDIEGKETIIGYGNAGVKPGGKFEMAVPTGRAFKEIKDRFATLPICEFRTTITSHVDESILQKIVYKQSPRKNENKKSALRGLLWCLNPPSNKQEKDNNSQKGSDGCFVDRDFNAAMNILKCTKMYPNRPDCLTRGHPSLDENKRYIAKWIKNNKLCHAPGKNKLQLPKTPLWRGF